jgi:hypothetical protein
MAIRYAGIEFDTVDELVRYKKMMENSEQTFDSKRLPIVSDTKARPKQRDGRKSEISDEKILSVLQSMKRAAIINRIHKKVGWMGNINTKQAIRIKEIASKHNLTGKIKVKRNKAQIPQTKSNKFRRYSANEKQIRDTMLAEKKSAGEIAKALNRPIQPIYNHISQMKRRKPFVPQSYEQKCISLANKQVVITEKIKPSAPFPELIINNGMLRLVTKDLIAKHINSINIDYADNLGIDEKTWIKFIMDFMLNSQKIAQHFGVPNKFKLASNNKIEYN